MAKNFDVRDWNIFGIGTGRTRSRGAADRQWDNGRTWDSISVVTEVRMHSRVRIFSVFFLLFACVLCGAQTATCTNWMFFNSRGQSSNHAARGINRWGTVVGSTHNAGSSLYPAFVRYPNGSLVTYSAPGSSATVFARRNSQGVTVGWFTDTTVASWDGLTHNHGWVLSGSSTATVNYPNAADTFLQGINRWGSIVGAYYDRNTYMEKAFVLKNSVFTHISPPGSSSIDWDSAMSINDKGVIAGWYFDTNIGRIVGFTLANGVYTTIENPKGKIGPDASTQVFDINNSGVMVGRYNFGFGFMYINGVFKDVQVPNYQVTSLDGINDYGDVTGRAEAQFYPYTSKLFTARCQ
jgi:hypothetical protein